MGLDAWLETVLPQQLPTFLRQQRWFGAKARPIRAVELEDAVWLSESPRPCAMIIAGVGYADDTRERYAMLLAFVDEPADLPVVGRLDALSHATWAVEAATDAESILALLRGCASARELPTVRNGRLRYGDLDEKAARALNDARPTMTIRPLGADQSNTSSRLDRTLVFKLFRKLDEGENPELEVGRFLMMRTRFRAVPMLRGSLTYVSAGGAPSTVGLLQDWIENQGDGWTYVVTQLREHHSTGLNGLLAEMFRLGVTTADFHGALAADATWPEFAPEPASADDVRDWRAACLDRASHTFALVERNEREWPEDERRLCELLMELRGRVATIVAGLDADAVEFRKIRIHGDYHLGQTLKTSHGFVLIDFEGEPARSLVERRSKQSALRDVAGMIRSFDYAVETVRSQRLNTSEDVIVSDRLREAFLEGYLSSTVHQRATFLPHARDAIDAWIDFFELEKALYEIEYEINNRPAWRYIPLQGMVRILRRRDR